MGFEPDLESSAVAGLGTNSGVNAMQITFPGRIDGIAVGDAVYRVESPGLEPGIVGLVDSVSDRAITYTHTGLGGTVTPVTPVQGDFILYSKTNVDKSGIIGFYNVVTMTNSETTKAELFSSNTSTFISSR